MHKVNMQQCNNEQAEKELNNRKLHINSVAST